MNKIVLEKCQPNKGARTRLKQLNPFIKSRPEKSLKSDLRLEINLQKIVHPVDAKVRPHLYKMNNPLEISVRHKTKLKLIP